MQENDRVFINHEDLNGYATIMYIASIREIYPVQVMFDEPPDGNGHKVYRFGWEHVQEAQDKPTRYVARVNRFKIGYFMGSEYIIEEPQEGKYFNVYNLDRPHGPPIGTYLSSFFEIIRPYKEVPKSDVIETKRVESGTNRVKVVQKEAESAQIPKEVEQNTNKAEQLTLFDMEW